MESANICIGWVQVQTSHLDVLLARNRIRATQLNVNCLFTADNICQWALSDMLVNYMVAVASFTRFFFLKSQLCQPSLSGKMCRPVFTNTTWTHTHTSFFLYPLCCDMFILKSKLPNSVPTVPPALLNRQNSYYTSPFTHMQYTSHTHTQIL